MESLSEKKRKDMHKIAEGILRKEKAAAKKQHKVLLLGCGEAGKSTFIKQLRIIHSSNWTDEERETYTRPIEIRKLIIVQLI